MQRFSTAQNSKIMPRALLFRGTIDAAAILVSPRIVGAEEARRRVLALWENGAALHEIGGDWLLIFATSRRLRCDAAPGLPLLRDGNLLLAAPFDDNEKRALHEQFSGAAQIVVTIKNGVADARVLASETARDPAQWISLDDFSLLEGESLGAVPPPVEKALAVPTFTAREKLPGVPAADKRLQEMLESLQKRAAGRESEFDATKNAWPASRFGLAARGALDAVFGLFNSRGKIVGVSNPMGGILHAGDLRFTLSLAFLVFAFQISSDATTRIFAAVGVAFILLRRFFGPALLADRGAQKAREQAASTRAAKARAEKESGNYWQRFMARAAMMSGLAQVIGRRQAQYIARTLKMFESGDTDAALRHAIPLQSLQELAKATPKPMFLGMFSSRDSLNINTQMRRAASTSSSISPEFMAHLRKIYRDAFEKMEARGELDKAAFILAELLNNGEEAVAFLEKHEKLQLAAELAEARKLSPGLVVRQWFLAGNIQRALDYARLRGAFSDAILRLERSGYNAQADALRLQWAQFLAESGNHLSAVQAAWRLPAAKELLLQSLDEARQLGGAVEGRALAWRVALAPENFASTRTDIVRLLDDETIDDAPARAAFATQLVETDALRVYHEKQASTRAAKDAAPRSDDAKNDDAKNTESTTPQNPARDAAQLILDMFPAPAPPISSAPTEVSAAPRDSEMTPQRAAQILARGAARTVLRDAASGAISQSRAAPLTKSLIELSGEGALRADFPAVFAPPTTLLSARAEPLQFSFEAEDAGALAALDAAALPDGKIIVALGEAGAQLLSRDARVLAHFDQPAHCLVVSNQGDRALALARRGRIWKMARLDFLNRSARAWCEAEIASAAETYDGALWFVATRDAVGNSALMAIDANAPTFRALWDTPNLEGEIEMIRVAPHSCSLLLQGNARPPSHGFFGLPAAQNAAPKRERWQFQLPDITLRRRDFLPEAPPDATACLISISPLGAILRLVARGENRDSITLFFNERSSDLSETLRGFVLYGGAHCNDDATWIAFLVTPSAAPETATCVVLMDAKELRVRALLHLHGARAAHLRFGEGALTCADDRGRVLVLDLESGTLRNDLRLR